MAKRAAWIEIVADADASGRLRELYDDCRDRASGVVDNIMAVHSLRPQTLAEHQSLYTTIMHAPNELSRAEREMIAVVVSTINECHY